MAKDQPTQIADYKILEELGSGASGAVYKAQHTATKKVVAIKLFFNELSAQDESRERFLSEAKALTELKHANIIQTFGSGEHEGQPYVITEFIEAKSLASVLHRRRLNLHESLAVIRHVCQGLWTAHSKGVVHYNLNPTNVLVSSNFSVVKITDLGISTAEESSGTINTLSTGQTLSGSLHYLAPEQATDTPEVDQRTNVYSVGVLFYEMLTGKVPLGRFNLPSSVNGEVPADFDTIVLKCLASDPADRYATIGRLLKDIFDTEDRLNLNVVRDLKGLSSSTSKILSLGTASLRQRKMITGTVVALLVAAIGGALAWKTMTKDAATDSFDSHISAQGSLPPMAQQEEDSPTSMEPEDLPEIVEDIDLNTKDEPKATSESPSTQPVAKPPKKQPAESQLPVDQTQDAAMLSKRDEVAEEYRIARSKYEAKLYGPAIADLESLQERFPDQPEALAAYFLTAEIHEVQGDIEQAMGTYVEIQSRYPDDARNAEIEYRLGRLTLRTGSRDRFMRAIEIFERVVSENPSSPWAPKSLRVKAEIERLRNLRYDDPELGPKIPAEVFTYRQLLQSYPEDEGVEEALWHTGVAFEKVKLFERAVDAFSQLASKFPETSYDVWWKLAQIYDRKLDDKQDAINSYSKVPETSEHYRDALKRLQKLQ